MVDPSVRSSIRSMSKSDLEEVSQYVSNRWKQLEIDAASRLSIGQTVSWRHKERGGYRTLSGPIAEINRSGRIKMGRCSDGRLWTISATMAIP